MDVPCSSCRYTLKPLRCSNKPTEALNNQQATQ
jgi:hypothetical protein